MFPAHAADARSQNLLITWEFLSGFLSHSTARSAVEPAASPFSYSESLGPQGELFWKSRCFQLSHGLDVNVLLLLFDWSER